MFDVALYLGIGFLVYRDQTKRAQIDLWDPYFYGSILAWPAIIAAGVFSAIIDWVLLRNVR